MSYSLQSKSPCATISTNISFGTTAVSNSNPTADHSTTTSIHVSFSTAAIFDSNTNTNAALVQQQASTSALTRTPSPITRVPTLRTTTNPISTTPMALIAAPMAAQPQVIPVMVAPAAAPLIQQQALAPAQAQVAAPVQQQVQVQVPVGPSVNLPGRNECLAPSFDNSQPEGLERYFANLQVLFN